MKRGHAPETRNACRCGATKGGGVTRCPDVLAPDCDPLCLSGPARGSPQGPVQNAVRGRFGEPTNPGADLATP
eukprot:3808901-Lingulodinium_polyedra.AAC.1